ncbi:MAG: hypothetical protein NUW00_01665 [Candidatus Kaiserbacteria bacterium]|nr:hypothetical protein [Candidatus Kaiserbacteria bacterium]
MSTEYSQRPFIELAKAGLIFGEGKAPKHIETVVSNVFVFEKTVYKLYKNDNKFFNEGFRDISGKEERFSFTRRDFEWNNTLSPAIYTRLMGIVVSDGQVEECSPESENADDLVIVMNRIDTNDILYEKLLRVEIDEDLAYVIGKQFGKKIKKIHRHIDGDYYSVFHGRIEDCREWSSSVSESMSLEESGEYCDFMKAFVENHRFHFENELSKEMVTVGDVHGHNAVFTDGELHFIDTFPPKEEWLQGHKNIDLYRLGADILALGGDDLFDAFMKGCADGGQTLNRDHEILYIMYASTIMVPYLYMLAKTDPRHIAPAKRYHDFVRTYFKNNCSVSN